MACYLVCPYEARYVTYLTKDVECINIGVEPKAVNVETYMRITGLTGREQAARYLETSWRAVEYIYDKYRDRVYLGVGLVYNFQKTRLEKTFSLRDATG